MINPFRYILQDKPSVKEYTFKELYNLYQIDQKTFRKWLFNYQVKMGRNTLFQTNEVEALISHIGFPYIIKGIEETNASGTTCKELKAPFEVRPYNLLQLSELYEVDRRTLKRWIESLKGELGELSGAYLLIPQIEIIIEKLGLPYKLLPDMPDKIKPYTQIELMTMYRIKHYKTWQKWIEPHQQLIGERLGNYYTIKQVLVIFSLFKVPFHYDFEED